jgi:superfamily I DNA/RNA helicase/RecB family exonuclease
MKFDPDPEQRLVLEHRRGPLLVTGMPGTGKTALLRERFARLIEAGADPERTALIVANRQAKDDARAALLARVHAPLPDLRVLTVHGLARQLVSRRFQELGYEQEPDVLNAAQQFAKVRELLEGEDPAHWPAYGRLLLLRGFADQVRQFLSRAQEALLAPQDVAAQSEAAGLKGYVELAGFYLRYLEVLDGEGVVDFAGLVEQAAAAAGKGSPLFDHVLVDDYQEATFATERLLAELGPITLTVAGDPGSHVFSFQGATDVPIRRFTESFPGAGHVVLGTNHRAPEGVAMTVWATPHTSEEHATVARELRRTHVEDGVPWGQLAVIVRRQRSDLGGLLRALDDLGVPRSVPERGFSLISEPATYPYILAMRWLARGDERDGLVEPLLTSDLARLSPAAARGLVREAVGAGGAPRDALEHVTGLSSSEAAAVSDLNAVLRSAEAVAVRSVLDTFSLLWRHLAHSRRLVAEGGATREGRRHQDAIVALTEAIEAASQREALSTAAFLDSLEAGREGPGQRPGMADRGADAVRVYTAHGAAGQEFDTVIVVGAVEGNFPSLSRPEPMFDLEALRRRASQSERNRRRLEDERRLFAVVTSRARRRVVLTCSDPHGGQTKLSVRSRFVDELGLAWAPAPTPPFPEPLTVAEAAAAWRRELADRSKPRERRLAALDGILALGGDCSRWWYQRDWTGTDRPLHEAIRVSHSRLEKLANCHLQYVLGQELGLEGRAGYHAWVGNLVHKLIEDCENGLVDRTREALVAQAEARWRDQEFPSRAVSHAFRSLVSQIMLSAWLQEYGTTPAVAKEIHFEFQFDDATVSGYIDRISRVQGGGSCITDYKTGKFRNAVKAEENMQLGIYYLAVGNAPELADFRPVKGVELAFLRDKDWRTGQMARAAKGFVAKDQAGYEEDMAKRLTDLIEELRDLQATENYRWSPSAECRFCDFKSLCPRWPEGTDVFPVPRPAQPDEAGASA